MYVVNAVTYTLYAYVYSPFCLGIQFLRRMSSYPVWIYFSTLGGEGIFVRVGVKTEFIASWFPPRMRTAGMMGHREGPPSQWRSLHAASKRKEIPMSLWGKIEPMKTKSHVVLVLFLRCKNYYFYPLEPHVAAWIYLAKLSLPAKLDLLQRSRCKLGQTILLGTAPSSKTIGSVDNFPQEVLDYFWSQSAFLSVPVYMEGFVKNGPCRVIVIMESGGSGHKIQNSYREEDSRVSSNYTLCIKTAVAKLIVLFG